MLNLMNPTTLSRDRRWQAIVDRDPTFDGQFYYSVKSTGVYCRPSCAARLPKPQNVAFHATCQAAEDAGFRACLRCKPRQPSPHARTMALVARLCREIESAEEEPSLDDLARLTGLSAWHLHRTFKAATGLTPKAYARAHRTARVRAQLADKRSTVTEAIYGAGFNSNGRFYATSDAILGMTPTRFQKGGEGADIRFAIAECSLGAILVATSGKGVCAISLGDDPETLARDLQDRFPKANLMGADAAFEDLVARVVAFVEQPGLGLDLPLDIRGTAFQQRVWQALRAIPSGATVSYADIAAALGEPKAVRAVAGACAANTLAVVIPCHRVVRTDGSLSGYRWGVERKRALLLKEARG